MSRHIKVAALDANEPADYSTEVHCPGAVLTLAEVSRQLRISRWSLYRLIHQRRLKTFKIGHRRLVAAAAVTDLIERLQEEAD